MIPNQWYAVYDAKKLKKNCLTGIKRLNEKLVIWRKDDNTIACIADRCAHRGASLALGRVNNKHVQCPFHGLEFDDKGKCVLIPANGRSAKVPDSFFVNSYTAVEKYGFIWIFWGSQKENLPDIPFFEDIESGLKYSQLESHWPMHYTRCIENQLDVLHLPFVHRTTIGKGNKTLINGPRVEIKDNGFLVYIKNEEDNGQKPLKPGEMPEPKPGQMHLHFLFPNLWQNFLSEKLRIVISFTPIDEENTIIYLRMYQKIVTIPLFRNLIHFIMMRYNLVILNQDRRVVITQLPKKSDVRMDERLVMGDLPIIKYRQIRQDLLERLNK